MGRIFFKLALLLLLSIPLPGLNLLKQTTFALDRSRLIKGKVIDAETKATIEFATISLLQETDTIPMQYTVTNAKGEFYFGHLAPGKYWVSVYYMGFKRYLSPTAELGQATTEYRFETFHLQPETLTIGEVTVNSNLGTPKYQTEKKTIYVENQLSGSGGTAFDLLHKLPSITQNMEGQLTIHGNPNLLVLINGKPSSMKGTELLEYTAASEIRKIEIITSPSAKYDATGSGGIINLITKKNTLNGLDGNLQGSVDHLGGYSSDLLMNYKRNKISFFAGIDNNRRKNKGDVKYETDWLQEQSHFFQTGQQTSQRYNFALRSGFDYTPTSFDKLSVSGHHGIFETTNHGNWQISQSGGTAYPDGLYGQATDHNNRPGDYSGADLTYEHTFKTANRSLSLSALWNALNYNDQFYNLVDDKSGTQMSSQTTTLDKKFNNYQYNLDFSTPTGKVGILELGAQFNQSKEMENYSSELISLAPPTSSQQKTNFHGWIGAAYGNWQFKIKKLELAAGLRAEYFDRSMKTLYDQFPLQQLNLYPSLNSSYRVDSSQTISFNYTRRTDQLKTIQLDPLPRWYNFYNVMIGNPALKNEITDKIAFNYLVNFRDLTLVNELFYYQTVNKIEVIQSVYQDQIIQNRYENSGSEKTLGIEMNARWKAGKWISLSQKVDFIRSRLVLTFDTNLRRRDFHQLYSVSTAAFTFSPTFVMEMEFTYFGPAMTAQTDIDQCYLAGLSLRKSFLNRKLTCTLTGRDIFGLYKKVEHITGNNFNQRIDLSNQFPIRLAISYKFHNYKRDDRKAAKIPLGE